MTSVMGELTRRHPRSASDALLEHAEDQGDEVAFQSIGLLQRLPDATVQEFVWRMQRRAVVQDVQRGPRGSLLRVFGRQARQAASPVEALRATTRSFPGAWLHVEAGQHTVRADCTATGAAAEAAAETLRRHWQGRGVPCEVTLRHVAGPQLRDWYEVPILLQDCARLPATRA